MSQVTVKGPLFDGRAQRTLDPMLAGVVEELAVVGNQIIDDLLLGSIKQPSSPPFYQGGIEHIVQRRRTFAVIHDSGVIYGPWLEGISSRNRSTRFKGYASFRRGAQRIESLAPRIAAPAVKRWIRKIS